MLEAHFVDQLGEQMAIQTGQRPSRGERTSWSRSIPALRTDLLAAGLDQVEMLLEYRLPLTSKRADVILAGVHPKTGNPSYVVVELKQWSDASRFEDSESLVRVGGYGDRAVTHPTIQVRDYCSYIRDFTAVLAQDDLHLAGAVYLHNATRTGVSDLFDLPGDDDGRLFTGDRRKDFHQYLTSVLAPGASGVEAADLLIGSKVGPSRQLLTVAAQEVQEREMFVLLDEQRDAYEYVLHAVEKARTANTKTAVVITGGPGSGKSVIALSLLGELARQGRTVLHATGSRSFTQTLRKVAGRRAPRVQKMFKYFNQFVEADPNDLDCLILDEAHRIRATSANRYTKAQLRTGRPQLDELIAAARVPVFLLDDFQVVRPGELGSSADIAAFAEDQGISTVEIRLDDQFRCGGSTLYVDWAQRLLGLADSAPNRWDGDDSFEVQIAQSPEELSAWVAAKSEQGFGARIAAGYCWPWSDPNPDGSLVPDVQIEKWAMPWNLRGDRSVGGAPPASLWATDPAGIDQVGCVYTAQGFEYDYAAVILGPDLVWRDDRWISVRAANRDPDFRSRKNVSDDEFDRLVRNVYKVLLTRGMLGVAIYSTDLETREFLDSMIDGSGPSR